MTDVNKPAHGFTKHGYAVYARTMDHLPDRSRYQRFNKKIALLLTNKVGTMTCFWVFCFLTLFILPSVLYSMGLISKDALGIAFVTSFGFELLLTWAFSTFLQLVLLPAIMVGQNLQNAAGDARAAKQFEDTEAIKNDMDTALDRLDCDTEGGLKYILDRFDALEALVTSAVNNMPPGAATTTP
jgi:hypothetical protein